MTTEEHRILVHTGVRVIAGVCDGAQRKDDQGFNASDTKLGKELANKALDKLDDHDVALCNNLCIHYQRQLGPEYLELQAMPLPPALEARLPIAVPTSNDPERIITSEEKEPTPSPPIPSISLTDEQSHAVETIINWHKAALAGTDMEFKLGGYAGTGKTTVIKFLLNELRSKTNIKVSAFTGKACAVLRRKGVPAQTLHSLMYDVEKEGDEVKFYKKSVLAGLPDLVIIDEASMLSTELYNDLKTYEVPLLFVGDPGQLEPVGDNPDLMRQPHLVLSKIHRQAEKSPIITLANSVRNGGAINPCETPELSVRNKAFTIADLNTATQIICAKNKTRQSYNDRIRMGRPGFVDRGLVEGEKLIVLRNNTNFLVFNGLILFVDKIVKTEQRRGKWSKQGQGDLCWIIDAHDEVGGTYKNLPIWQEPFKRDLAKGEYPPKHVVHADYGYVITCHKSQGSEWEHVFVVDEWMPATCWDMKRWRYTAITRAAQKLTYAI